MRDRALAGTLFILTSIIAYVAFLICRPFLSPLVWALALAIVFYPFHLQLRQRVKSANLSATISVVIVAFLVVGPIFIAGQQIASQVGTTVEAVREGKVQAQIEQAVQRNRVATRLYNWAMERFNAGDAISQVASLAGDKLTTFLTGSLASVLVLMVTFFFLFYFLRDAARGINTLRLVLPLSEGETDRLLLRIKHTIQATVFGTLAVAAVQGILGGAIFWGLGLPAPALWGVVMGLLAVVPVLGAFVIWVPAAIYLALSGFWWKAIVLSIFGTLVIGLVDNILYPMFVGKRLELHTVPVFISIVGGLLVFGGAGIILGPLVLAIAHGLMEIWRQRARTGKIIRPGVQI